MAIVFQCRVSKRLKITLNQSTQLFVATMLHGKVLNAILHCNIDAVGENRKAHKIVFLSSHSRLWLRYGPRGGGGGEGLTPGDSNCNMTKGET